MTPDEWRLTIMFPALRNSRFEITSEYDHLYNCVGWVVGLTTEWWEPNFEDGVWPDGVAPERTVTATIHALATVGYEPCEDGNLQEGFEKAAIFGEGDLFIHAARQLPSGLWTSKLGSAWDIVHELGALTSAANAGGPVQYGEVVAFLRRARAG